MEIYLHIQKKILQINTKPKVIIQNFYDKFDENSINLVFMFRPTMPYSVIILYVKTFFSLRININYLSYNI